MKVPKERLATFRATLKKHGLDAYVVFHQDAHNSEYVSSPDERRTWISGFSGSSGTALITPTAALLWTDGRYFLQVQQELSEEWVLMKDRLPETISIEAWLAKNVSTGKIGLDPLLTTSSFFKKLKEALGTEDRIACTDENLVDECWKDRPPVPKTPVFIHPIQLAGKSPSDKIKDVRSKMMADKVDCLALNKLEEIAWLLNLRGSDVPHNPVFFSYLLLPNEGQPKLYIHDPPRLSPPVAAHLKDLGVVVLPYEQFLKDLKATANAPNAPRILLDSENANLAMLRAVPEKQVVSKQSPIAMMKCIKNEAELDGMRACHVRDGAAKSKFLCWLELQDLDANQITEITAADKLEAFRRQDPLCVDLSFPSISGSGSNGAVIHYRPKKDTAKRIDKGMYLIDSGAQYKDGTTDITRTVCLGPPSQHQKECFTRVLKGHIALARCIFPPGTSGPQIDCLARAALWEIGLDYPHGTGHGVGSFLCVHEGPCGISTRVNTSQGSTPLAAGMVLSNEPGYYEDGEFGIRIENLMIVVKADTRNRFNNQDFLTFETITMVPIQKKLIDWEIMTREEVEWLNDYHQQVFTHLEPLIGDEEPYASWLRTATAPEPVPMYAPAFIPPPPVSLYQ